MRALNPQNPISGLGLLGKFLKSAPYPASDGSRFGQATGEQETDSGAEKADAQDTWTHLGLNQTRFLDPQASNYRLY